jgi:GDPmannose 4,6-dehydratase
LRALITGINGQDGSYLADLLLSKGYEVHGTIRRASTPNLERIAHLRDNHRVTLHFADMADATSLHRVVAVSQPDYVYNLAAMSDVRVSFDVPMYAAQVDAVGALGLFEAVRLERPEARVYQAGSSEMFGMNPDVPCDESSQFYPGSPYAAAKTMALHCAVNYREAFGMFVANGILFNHESERRGVEFVTRKITRYIGALTRGETDRPLELGALTPSRDWGYAPDYVRAMVTMLEADQPGDYVVATGETHSVYEFVQAAFDYAGLDWNEHVVSNQQYLLRPTDPPVLLGNSDKIKRELGWSPQVGFHELVEHMVEADL